VDGKEYRNTAALNVAVGGNGFYHVVLRKTWATQTVRVAILGPQAVTPPSVTQTDGTLWEISLATFEKSGGVIGSIVDTCGYMNAETKFLVVPVQDGWNITLAARLDSYLIAMGYIMPDNNESLVYGQWAVPMDYISNLSIKAICVPGATGDIYCLLETRSGQCSEDWATHIDQAGYNAITVTFHERSCIQEVLPGSITAGDLFSISFARDATNALDTISNFVCGAGFLIEYLGKV